MTHAKGLTVLFAALALGAGAARADVRDDQQLVDSAARTVAALHRQYQHPLDTVLARAKAVVVFPNIIKAGFIVGGAGGPGVLMVRRPDGSWSEPAFYGFAAASVGLQAGIQDQAVLMAIMTDGGLAKIMSNNVKLGADLAIAAGPIGGGVEAATTTNGGADIYTYSKNQGLFAGGALNGAVISPSEDRDREYYGTPDSRTIVAMQGVRPGTTALRKTLGGAHLASR